MTMLQEAPAPPLTRAVPTPEIRRRRTALILAALAAAAVLAVLGTGSVAAWGALGGVIVLGGLYGAVLRRSRRQAFEREFNALVASTPLSFDDLSDMTELAKKADTFAPSALPLADSAPAWRRVGGIGRFIVSVALGWLLAPMVFALTILFGRTPKDTTGKRWLANLQRSRAQLREHGRRGLAVSITTAGVSAVGTAAVFGGAGAASAAPVVASAGIGLTASASATVAAGGTAYTVVAGDTLARIADRYGTTYEAIAEANHISNPDLIFPGETLAIPSDGSAAPSSASSGGGTYTVVAGDTLARIADRYGTTYEAIAEANHLANPNFIEVGEILDLPGGSSASADTSAPIAVAAKTAPATTVSTAASSGAKLAVATAIAQIGKPYVWAGAGPSSFDCSGLVMYAWRAAGVSLPHYSVAQYDDTERISESQLEPGDLVFYDNDSGAQPGHVTLYIGGGQVVTADEPGTDVRVESLTWDGHPMGFGRVR